jgi:hypothetical protein
MLVFLLLAGLAHGATLRIQVTDEAGNAIWARLEVYGPDGKKRLPSNAIVDPQAGSARERPGYYSSFVMRSVCEIDTTEGEHKIIVEHGLEYPRIERTVLVTSTGSELKLQLKPWIRARQRGWWSADLHVHRPPEHVEALALAEDLNLSVVFTMWNARNLWAGKQLPKDPIVRISPHHLATLMNAEDERGGGAWMLHQIPEPLPLSPSARWYPPGLRLVQMAREKRRALFPWFDLEKLIWWEAPAMMALEPPDSFGVLNNHFQQYGMLDNEAWARARDKHQFPRYADYSTHLYYRYLNLGFRMPATAGSASGVLPNPVGYNRVYVPLRGKSFTVENWYAALRDGGGFVTNGPMLFFSAKEMKGTVTGSVEVLSRDHIDRIEVIANGEVVKTFRPFLGNWKGKFALEVKNHSWVAARAFVRGSPGVRMAHSSPVWLSGKWDARSDAKYFVAWMDELIAQTRNDEKRFQHKTERDEVLTFYDKARAYYARRAE